jgi:hypothetical protein
VRLTSLSRSLLADDASGLAGWARLIGEPWIWQMWGHLPEAVRGGGSAFHAAHGCSFWEFVDAHADAATVFHEGMSALSRADARAVVPRLDLRDCRLIVDVGGGHGVLLTACLQKATGGRGVLYDRRSVVAEGIQRIRRQHLQARCHAVAGDFRTWVPSGGDLYLLKRVLQDWGEADAVAILRGCRQAMGPESRLAIIERLMPEGPDAAAAALADLTMLAAVPGRVRRREEIACLARAAGLRLVEVRSAGELSVVELRREQADAKRS